MVWWLVGGGEGTDAQLDLTRHDALKVGKVNELENANVVSDGQQLVLWKGRQRDVGVLPGVVGANQAQRPVIVQQIDQVRRNLRVKAYQRPAVVARVPRGEGGAVEQVSNPRRKA